MSTFTEAQREAIHAQGNVLVSAGAGTGKTRTVVERCLRLIKSGCSLENILMVTFTEAAAAEMRERLRKELENALSANLPLPSTGRGNEGEGWEGKETLDAQAVSRVASPLTPTLSPLRGEGEAGGASSGSKASSIGSAQHSVRYLQEQLALLDAAHISTLHAFCLELIRDHFYELHIDPQVSVLDESQTVPLMHETLDALLARCYAGDVEFSSGVQELVRQHGGSDEKLRSLVLKLHRYTQSLPPSACWYERELSRLEADEPTHWREWLARGFIEWRDEWLPEAALYSASPHVARCVEAIRKVLSQSNPADIAEAMRCIIATEAETWKKPHTKKDYRDPIRAFFDDARFLLSLTEPREGRDPLTEDWEWLRGPTRAVLRLAQQFTADFTKAKRAQGGIDFADLEQLALQLLVDGQGKPTDIARIWQQRFEYVFVDECQDINAAQDAIISAVSRSADGHVRTTSQADDLADATVRAPNRFLVGDVKQSIYRFRLANPAIFRAYEEQWRSGDGGRRIALADNFRSRESILNFINPLFAALMRPGIGGVSYDADAQLKFGAPEERVELCAGTPPIPRVELHVLRKADDEADANGVEESEPAENGDGSAPAEDVLTIEKEARLVARRLRELRDSGHTIWEEDRKAMRAVEWRDMVVLLRSPGSRVETFAKEFSRAGIPLAAARAGFYSATEVQDLLNLLRLLDNPLQDIPFAAVLRSPLVALTPDEFAALRITGADGDKRVSFVAAAHLAYFRSRNIDPTLNEIVSRARTKLGMFLQSFERWRSLVRQTSVAHCLETVLAETHYEALLLAQPRGRERVANVHRLLTLARQYDPFQRQGLYRFLRFVSEQEDSDLDQEAAVVDVANAVRLMSIHKSKGLEFPVVVVACLAAQFNTQDLREDMLLSGELGLCSRVVPPHVEQSYPSLPWWLAKRREQRELLGEEMRLLYVAMTRARDTLVLTAFDKSKEASERWHLRDARLDDRAVLKAQSYFGWIRRWLGETTTDEDWRNEREGANALLTWKSYAEHEIIAPPAARVEVIAENGAAERPVDMDALRARLTWSYPHLAATNESAKTNVSLLRRRTLEGDDEARHLFTRHVVPRRRDGLSAADVGSAHHAFLQRVDFERTGSMMDLRNEAQRLLAAGHLTSEEEGALNYQALLEFWISPLGRRVVTERSTAQREMPFTARFTTEELRGLKLSNGKFSDHEFVIVQGVVDLALVGPDSISVIDFKTDRLRDDELDARVDEYRVQLKLYGAALERSYGRPVRERWLHFLALGKSIAV